MTESKLGTIAPKVYRMADESWLFNWATCYAWSEATNNWWQYEHKPKPMSNHYEPIAGRTMPILAHHAPQDLPDDFDWRDSLVMVKEKDK